ncbi:phosphatase PAP2 family protein [Hydrogenophaga sp.]|uniref:phosphatase PAP2 family protein n=1 Tax=Hydrogenophaga sp. TaxID=1904254 RepID=UPI0035B43A5B
MSGGMSGPGTSADAMTQNRSALAGPFAGATLHPPDHAFDDPAQLPLWDDGPRLSACESELLEGLSFSTHAGQQRASLRFTHLQAAQPVTHALVRLRAPDQAVLSQQLDLVAAYADLRADREAEILAQLSFPITFWNAVVGLSPHRHKRTMQLIELGFSLAVHVEMRFKHIFAVRRPMEYSPQIQPMIPTPGHGAWPSGHATEAFLTARLFKSLLDEAPAGLQRGATCEEQLQRLAARIASNRVVAGVHYPVDSAAGRVLGTALADFLVARCKGSRMVPRDFDGRQFLGVDGEPADLRLSDPIDQGAGGVLGAPVRLPAAPMLAWLWNAARDEWR